MSGREQARKRKREKEGKDRRMKMVRCLVIGTCRE